MPEETIALTQRALHRLKVIEAVTDRRLTQAAAGGQLGITARQVKRLVAAYRADGAAGLVSRRIGQPSNRRIKESLREAIRAGHLAEGSRLPTVRDLAWRLDVTPGTVSRAYQIVTQEGLLEATVGRGTFEVLPQ